MVAEINLEEIELLGDIYASTQALTKLEKGFVPNVKIDSREVEQGDVFLGLQGNSLNGNDFAQNAIDKGAVLCILDKVWLENNKLTISKKESAIVSVDNTLIAVQTLAHRYRKKFSCPIIAIGGNSGKTTCKEILHALLSKTFNTTSTEKNFNNHLGVPLTLLRIRPSTEVSVIEMGISRPQEMTALCEIAEPTHGVITNIGTAHIEFFQNQDEIRKAEGELFEYLEKKKGVLFVNENDSNVILTTPKKNNVKTIYYGYNSTSNNTIYNIKSLENGTRTKATLEINNQIIEIDFALVGNHNVENVLAAATIAYYLGVPILKIRDSFFNFRLSPNLNRSSIEFFLGLKIFNDTYNANPESMKAAIQTLSDDKTSSRRIAVLGDMLELGKDTETSHEALGLYIKHRRIDAIFALGNYSNILSRSSKCSHSFAFENKDRLVDQLCLFVKKNDMLLFKGSRGMRMEEVLSRFKKKMQLSQKN